VKAHRLVVAHAVHEMLLVGVVVVVRGDGAGIVDAHFTP
jgi:hypothetical protein